MADTGTPDITGTPLRLPIWPSRAAVSRSGPFRELANCFRLIVCCSGAEPIPSCAALLPVVWGISKTGGACRLYGSPEQRTFGGVRRREAVIGGAGGGGGMPYTSTRAFREVGERDILNSFCPEEYP